MIAEIKERLATLGYDATSEDKDFIAFVLSKTNERIKMFTNLPVVPDELKHEIIDVVASEFMLAKLATNGLDIERAVQSITEGDVSVTYVNGSDKVTLLKNYYASMSLDFGALNRFRKLVW